MSTIRLDDQFRLRFVNTPNFTIGQSAYLGIVGGNLAIDTTEPPGPNTLFALYRNCTTEPLLTYSSPKMPPYSFVLKLAYAAFYLAIVNGYYQIVDYLGDCSTSDNTTFRVVSKNCTSSNCPLVGTSVFDGDTFQLQDTAFGQSVAAGKTGDGNDIITTCNSGVSGNCNIYNTSYITIEKFTPQVGSTNPALPIMPITTGPVTVIVISDCEKKYRKCRCSTCVAKLTEY